MALDEDVTTRNKERIEGLSYMLTHLDEMPEQIVNNLTQNLAEASKKFEAGDYEGGGKILGELDAGILSTAFGLGSSVAQLSEGAVKAFGKIGGKVDIKIGASGEVKMVRKTQTADGIKIEVPVKKTEQDYILVGDSAYTQSSKIEKGTTVQLDQNIVTADGHVIPNGSIVTETGGALKIVTPDGTTIIGPTDKVVQNYPAVTNWFKDTAQTATKNPDSDTVLLGSHSKTGISYEKVAQENNATYFELDNWDQVMAGLDRNVQWKVNKNFLEQQISQGKKIIFSHDPDKAIEGTFFWDEVSYLRGQAKLNFRRRDDGLWEAYK